MSQVTVMSDVLALEETAHYLRLPKGAVERQATRGQIPGRRIEDTWRFLKAAIDDWLWSLDSRTILLQQAGRWQTMRHYPNSAQRFMLNVVARRLMRR